MQSTSDQHDQNKRDRGRYKIVIPKMEVDEPRRTKNSQGPFTGDIVQEYWDGKLIREHKFTVAVTTEQPTQATQNRYYSQGLGRPPDETVYTPKFETIIHDMNNVPQEIATGEWSNPDQDVAYIPTHQVGKKWGIYANDYIDAFTLEMLDPLIKRYTEQEKFIKHQLTIMEMERATIELRTRAIQRAKRELESVTQTVSLKGGMDNTPEIENEMKLYIQKLDGKIQVASTILGIPSVSSWKYDVSSQPQQDAFDSTPRADMGAMMDMRNGANIHERLESLKHLGGSYSMTGNGSYSCDVTVYNYTSMGNRTPHTWKTTVSWNTGDGNLESALIRKLGSASTWSIMYTGADGQKYNSFMYLQANVEDDLKNYKTRDDVMVHIYF